MISKELAWALQALIREAKSRQHEYLTIEHLLLAALHDARGKEIIMACGGDVARLEAVLEKFFAANVPKLPSGSLAEPEPTVGFHRVIEKALIQVQSAEKQAADMGDILAAIFLETDAHAAHFLEAEGITRLDILNYVSHGITKDDAAFTDETDDDDDDDGTDTRGAPTGTRPGPQRHGDGEQDGEDAPPVRGDPLKAFAVDLNEKAARGAIDPLIGRTREIQRAVQVLCRRKKNNLIFVGDPGVGKTAMVEGLALKIHKKEVPSVLENVRIYALDLGGMLAGTRYRGDFEARLKATLKAVQNIPGAILFIDEIHALVGAGATSGGSLDAANLLKPLLNAGTIRCIGASTHEECKNFFEKDRALARRFEKIDLPEPSHKETVKIITGLVPAYEAFHQVKYTRGAIIAAARLARKYLRDRFLPDKALDLIDEAGAVCKLETTFTPGKRVGTRLIEKAVAKMARIPAMRVGGSDAERLRKLETELKAVIFGQDEAIGTLVTAIKRSRAGLGAAQRPIGNFLFTGPTGVGKTEVSRQLARVLGVQFLRFDMSEYMEKHAVSRLIGAPPGYVGFDQGGLLTDAVRRNPYTVLLLDEIEKAHPDLFNILLQVMDYAVLTDNNGKKADFRNVILIMTSNVGAMELDRNMIGFGDRTGDVQAGRENAVNRLFSPEFRNRLDATVNFAPLTPAIMLQVVGKFMRELDGQLAPKKVTLVLSDAVRAWLGEKGYHPKHGARPLGRVLQREIKDRLADEILFGQLRNGGEARLDLDQGKIVFAFTPAAAPTEPARKKKKTEKQE